MGFEPTTKLHSDLRTHDTGKPVHLSQALSEIINCGLWMQRSGYRPSTIQSCVSALKAVARRSNLLDPENVKAYVASAPVSENRKQTIFEHLTRFYKWKHIPFSAPRWKRIEVLPFIPTEIEINQLISGVDAKRAAFLQLVKETACRPGEAWGLRWIDLDTERNCVRISPEKNSRPRERKITRRLFAMLDRLPKRWEMVFHNPELEPVESLDDFRRTFIRQRSLVAEKLQNPRIKRITFKTLRHFTATMEYHKTKDILHVMNLLGHKNIKNTLVYTHLVSFETDEFVCKVAGTIKEATQLLEVGFDYVTEMDGNKLFRKRK